MQFETLAVDLRDGIATVRLNRPERGNAINASMWQEIRQAFEWVDQTPQARVAILQGEGRHFCTGIDLQMLMELSAQVQQGDCAGRSREELRRVILDMQETLSSLERCRKPVLAAIHGTCMGGGLDLVCCADMRYASQDVAFCIKEIDFGLTADVGTLQRLPRLAGEGMARELAYTGRSFHATEALEMRLLNRIFDTHEALYEGVRAIAATIASKSPLAVRGTKEMITFARDHTVADGLNQVATWNAAVLISADLSEAMAAYVQKRRPHFRD
jgi:enoyl-CoA hydratase/carnithine racemase